MQPKIGSDFVSLNCCTFFLGCFLSPPPLSSLLIAVVFVGDSVSENGLWKQRETAVSSLIFARSPANTFSYAGYLLTAPIFLFLFLFNCLSSVYSFCPSSVPMPSIKTAVIKLIQCLVDLHFRFILHMVCFYFSLCTVQIHPDYSQSIWRTPLNTTFI